jgi:hypothetical protein
MRTRIFFLLIVMCVGVMAASCASLNNWGTTDPPIARVNVINFAPSTDIGITTEINFSVANVTDQDLTGLTLTITTNPSDGLELPYREKTIDRISAHGTWNPGPYIVRGRKSGTTSVFFMVSKDGTFLAKDYSLVNVAPEEYFGRPPF